MLGLLLVGTTPARAQDERQVGLTMGYPASVGLLWHVADNIAIRPELSLSRSSVEASSLDFGVDGTDGWMLGTGVSVLAYLQSGNSLRTYVSPRFTYSRSESTSSGENVTDRETIGTNYSVSGFFGAQYALGDRFSVFGEVGFGYNWQNFEARGLFGSQEITTETESHGWSTRTGVGVVLYF
jgi:hypothetical protein